MRKFLFSASIILSLSASAQQPKLCGTTEASNEWFNQHPELKQQFELSLSEAETADKQQFKNGHYSSTSSVASYTIPVVFHILHTGGSENISDAQIQDAVNILSRDYQKMNADTSVVIAAFKSIIGNAQIEFQLAKRDPNGNCTNGIIRHYTSKTDWTSGAFGDYIYSWPRQKYLNVYVVKSISSGAAGYTYLPGSGVPSAADAIVILSTYVGSIGTGNVGTSRALTHEVGHWLNLPHVWGGTNQPGVACGDDGVSDTPVTKGFTSCALNNSDICNSGTPENVQNYMDYSYCSRMFTQGQVIRMQNALASATAGRNNLSSASNLTATGITNPATNCITMIEVNASPSKTVCSSNTLTVLSYTSNATPTSYSWSANNGAIPSNPGASTTPVSFPNPGQTTVTCFAMTASGTASAQVVITVLNSGTAIVSPYSESFETAVIPAGWSIGNPDNGTTWAQTSGAAHTGVNSYFINGSAMPSAQVDYLNMPTIDVLNNPSDSLTFKYAYARYSSTHQDIFKVEASKDCGGNWTTIFNPSAASMANNSGATTTNAFFPTLSQWKHVKLNDYPSWSTLSNSPSVWIRFTFQEAAAGNGNNFFLDDINFSSINIGMNELVKNSAYTLYPNPANGEAFVKFNLHDASLVKVEVLDVLGRNVIPASEFNLASGEHTVSLNKNTTLSQGIYFVNLSINGAKMSKKLIIK